MYSVTYNPVYSHSRIKELTLGSRTLLHATRMWSEAVITMQCTFSFKIEYQRYNSLEMDEDEKTPKQKFSGVEFHFFPYRLTHIGLTFLHPRNPTVGRAGRATQMGIKGEDQSLSWTLPIPCRVSGPSIKH